MRDDPAQVRFPRRETDDEGAALSGDSGQRKPKPADEASASGQRQRKPLEFGLLEMREPYPAAVAAHERAVARVRAAEAELVAVIERHLGPHGRMITASKSGYDRRYPTHLTVFNANLVVDRCKLWWGDLDLTVDEPKLRAIAGELGGRDLYVLYEHDARFRTEEEPQLERYVYWTDGRERRLGPETERYYEWRRGRPRRRRTDAG